jgi:hypothetical protein
VELGVCDRREGRPAAFRWFGHSGSISPDGSAPSSLLERDGSPRVRWTVDQVFGSQLRGMSSGTAADE